MAFEAARYGKKLLDADKDVGRYRERMNAVADAQAERMGASIQAAKAVAGTLGKQEDDGMEVFTNSPITTETVVNHHYASPDAKSQLATISAVAAIALLSLALAASILRPVQQPINPTPEPVPAASTAWDVTISVR